ncbi:MAG: YlmC/YmxH family sporulation protein [Clostridia bacterium]|nr:YlmC/YmxH family sporulation protein [Clostridia bacterium]
MCRIYEFGYKEVIDLSDGSRLGYISDVEIDIESGQVRSAVIPGRLRRFGLLGREDDKVIPWEHIEKIGEDIILVRSRKHKILPDTQKGAE